MLRRALKYTVAGGFVAAAATAVKNRPTPDRPDAGKLDHLPTREEYLQNRQQDEGLLMTLARMFVIGGTAATCRLWLHGLNDYKMRDTHKLVPHVRDRPPGQSLVTVSNHTSTLDDPGIVATVLPYTVVSNPFLLRWSACSQEICHKDAFVGTFFGAGKVLPIKRGGGIDQPLLEQLAHRLAAGDWVHIFPEGGVVQTGRLGGRKSPRREEIGRLKWGVGKLIAEAGDDGSLLPIIVPFYHTGMHTIVPQNPETHEVLSMLPGTGKKVRVLVGDPIEVADLVEEHREARAAARALVPADADPWFSTDADKALYSAIARRIEDTLLELQERTLAFAREDDGEEFTPTESAGWTSA